MRPPVTLLLLLALVAASILPSGPIARAGDIHEPDPFVAPPALSGAGLSAPAVDMRVNAGGPNYTDSQLNLWLADQLYIPGQWGHTAGTAYTPLTPFDILGTTDDPLYLTQRSSPGQYKFDVGNGVFQVELRFAEIYATTNVRSYSVKLEGATVLSAFNPFVAAGYARAMSATFLVKVTDMQLNIEFSGTQPIINAIRVTGGPTGLGTNEVRMNAAGFDYTDSLGKLWVSDQAYLQGTRGYQGAQSSTDSTTLAILNTNDQKLLQTNRYNMTGYAFDLDNGWYRVDLHFAELYASVNSTGARVFDVWAEGVKMIADLDVFTVSGNRYKAITRTLEVNVIDAQLNITFTKKASSPNPPIVNAIAVLPLDSTGPTPWTNFAPTGWQTTQTPASSISVQDALSGLDVLSGQYAFSTNGGSSFSPWISATLSGSNGTTSTQTLSVAAVPFNQDSATQNRIKFQARDMSGNLGASGVYTIPIDTTPPSSVITSPAPNSLVAGSSLTIQGTASDAASGVQSVEVSTNGGASWQTASGTTNWSYLWTIGGEGVYSLRSRARDNLGMVETPGAGISVTVDSVPPVTFIRTPTNGQVISSTTYMITGTAFDATSGVDRVELSFDGGANWVPAVGTVLWSYIWTPSGQGGHTIRARAVDRAGNVDNPGTTVSVVADRVAPTSTITDPTAGRVVRGISYVVSGLASDDAGGSGLSKVEVSADGATWHNADGLATWTYTWVLPADGSYTVRSRATDQAGNVQAPPTSVTVVVDNAPPVSVASLNGTAGNDGWYISPVTLELLASDAGSGVRSIHFRLDSGAWLTYTTQVQISTVGNSTISYYAVDNAGNSEAARTLPVRIDTAPPAIIRFLSGTVGGGGWFRSAVLFNLVVADPISSVRETLYSLDSGPWTNYTGIFSISSEGQHTVLYYATDRAGNSTAVETASFGIDTLAPTTQIAYPAAGQVVSGTTMIIQGTASDGAGSGLANVEVSINGGAWMPASGGASWTYSWTPPSPGQHNIRVRANDIAHNVESVGAGIYITVDTTRPSSSIVSPYNGQVVQGPIAVVVGSSTDTYSSVGLVEVSTNNGQTWAPAVLGGGGAWVYTWTIPNDGIYNLRSRATDLAGNVEIPGAGVGVQVDSIAPQSQIVDPTDGQGIRAGAYAIGGTSTDVGSGVKRIEVSVDNGPWMLAIGTAQWSYAWNPIGADGWRTLRSRATDNAGNTETPRPAVTVVVDNGKPTSSIMLPTSGQVITTPMLFISGASSDAVSGVKRVEITVRRGLDSYYWSGSEWTPDETWLPTDGPTSEWNYLMSDLPKVGMLTIVSRATDNMGNVETPGAGVTISIQRGFTVVMPIIINEYSP